MMYIVIAITCQVVAPCTLALVLRWLCVYIVEFYSALYVCMLVCRYSAGDVLMVMPQNTPEAVDDFLKVMKLDPNQGVSLSQSSPGVLGAPCTEPTLYLSLGLHHVSCRVYTISPDNICTCVCLCAPIPDNTVYTNPLLCA